MRVFCYFVEPAGYTIDLINNIYKKKGIPYCFLYDTSFARSRNFSENEIFLSRCNFIEKIGFIFKVWKNNDLIIINGYNNYPFILTFLLNLFGWNKRYIAVESDTQLVIPSNYLKRIIKALYLSFIFDNKFILGFAGGNNTHKDLFSYYGMSESSIFLMPMMVNNSRFYISNKKRPNTFTFLYVGRLEKHKGVKQLIEQFNIKFHDKDAILKIIGSGNHEQYLKSRFESNKVIFVGKKIDEELIKEYHSASCFVCPSLFEPWGLVINEALSSSLPVISTVNVGANFDLILDKKTGFISKNMDEFGDNMFELYNNNELIDKFSNNGFNLMSQYWNYSLYSDCLEKVFQSLDI